jgi:xylose isomerase
MKAKDLGVRFGAGVCFFWGEREGVESDATKDPVEAMIA